MRCIVMLLLLTACSSRGPVQLSEKAKEIEVLNSKPNGCHVVGKVIGKSEIGSKELALNDALNQSADMGASSLFVNQEVPNGKLMNVYGTAYHCE
jgi:hypothetical protein